MNTDYETERNCAIAWLDDKGTHYQSKWVSRTDLPRYIEKVKYLRFKPIYVVTRRIKSPT